MVEHEGIRKSCRKIFTLPFINSSIFLRLLIAETFSKFFLTFKAYNFSIRNYWIFNFRIILLKKFQ